MNEIAFQELLLDARISESVSGLRKLILASALRGDFDDQKERQRQLSDALNAIHVLAASNKTKKGRAHKESSEVDTAEDLLSIGNDFVVELGAIATIEKGKTGIKDAIPGEYPLVVTAEGRLTADHFDFEGPAVVIPLVSSTGHGDASLKRIHYQEGKYAVGSILCAVQSRFPELVHPRYLYEYLSTFKEELLVSRMSGTANVSLTVGKIAEVPVPLITYEAQDKLDRLMSLCDALEASGQLEAQQHAQLVGTLLGTLTQSETPEALADNWQRIATHFDVLLDRPEAVDALEQTILQLAVRGLLVPQDPTDEPASVLLQKIRTKKDHLITQGKIKRDKPLPPITDEEKPFELPQGWEWVRLGDVWQSSFYGPRFGNDEYVSTGGLPTIRTTDMTDGQIILKNPPRVNVPIGKYDTYLVKKGDLLVTRSGSIGVMALFDLDIDAVPSAYLIRLRFSQFVLPTYCAKYFFSELGQAQLGLNTTAVGVPNVSASKMAEFYFPLAPFAEQDRIVIRINELRSLCADLRQRLTARQEVQSHLADALVTG